MDDFGPRGVNWKDKFEYIDMTMFVSADVEVEVLFGESMVTVLEDGHVVFKVTLCAKIKPGWCKSWPLPDDILCIRLLKLETRTDDQRSWPRLSATTPVAATALTAATSQRKRGSAKEHLKILFKAAQGGNKAEIGIKLKDLISKAKAAPSTTAPPGGPSGAASCAPASKPAPSLLPPPHPACLVARPAARRPLSSLHAAPSSSGRGGALARRTPTRPAAGMPKSAPQPKRAKAAPKAPAKKQGRGDDSEAEEDDFISGSSGGEAEEEEMASGSDNDGSQAGVAESDGEQENVPPNVPPNAPSLPKARHAVAAGAAKPAKPNSQLSQRRLAAQAGSKAAAAVPLVSPPPAVRTFPVLDLDDADDDAFQ